MITNSLKMFKMLY